MIRFPGPDSSLCELCVPSRSIMRFPVQRFSVSVFEFATIRFFRVPCVLLRQTGSGDGSLRTHNDLSFAQDESLYAGTGMERADTRSVYARTGIDLARTRSVPCLTWNASPRTRSVYARTGMDLVRTRPVPCLTWNASSRTGSNGGHTKRVDSAASAC